MQSLQCIVTRSAVKHIAAHSLEPAENVAVLVIRQVLHLFAGFGINVDAAFVGDVAQAPIFVDDARAAFRLWELLWIDVFVVELHTEF